MSNSPEFDRCMAPYWTWKFLCMAQDLALEGSGRVLRWGMAMQLIERYGPDNPRPGAVTQDQVLVPGAITPASAVSP